MASPEVCVSPTNGPLLDEEVSLNTLSPTLNAGFPETFGSGISKVPVHLPVKLATIGSPAAGVLYTVVPELWFPVTVPLTPVNPVPFVPV